MRKSETARKITCLVIDDEKEARDRLLSLLKNIEYVEVIAEEDKPESAIKTILELNPDLVLIDVEMPRLSGFDVIKAIRKNNCDPKFIFITGYDQYAIKAIKTQAFDYLLKPVDIDELKDTLERFNRSINFNKSHEIPVDIIRKFLLTPREIQIIKLLIESKNSRQIAEKLFISIYTVETHRKNILKKTNFNSTQELLTFLFHH